MTGIYKYKKVLVIDDNEIDRYVADMVMKTNSFAEEVVSVESARKALDYLISFEKDEEQLPQLIFLDINMPEMSGFDFLDEYQKLPENVKNHCIIMMLTTSLNQDDKIRAQANKFVYKFVNKPLDREKLSRFDIPVK
jgi:CheY-like chemotaxis protein